MRKFIIGILLVGIAVVGYLIFRDMDGVFRDDNPTEVQEPKVMQLNDTTFHINLSDYMCTTLTKNCDTLDIDAMGATMVMANKESDTIKFVYIEKDHTIMQYAITYSDYFDTIRFEHLNIRFNN